MKKITNLIRLFTLIGILSTIIGYLFLLHKGYSLYNEINVKKTEIDQLEELRIEKNRQLTELETKIINITLTSSDTNTVNQGVMLAREIGIPVSNYFRETSIEETSLVNARKYEEQGYEMLLNKDIDGSIEAFITSENSYNGYHQVYEIARYLIRNKNELSDINSDYWNEVYQTILSQYSWKMPENYKLKFREQIK